MAEAFKIWFKRLVFATCVTHIIYLIYLLCCLYMKCRRVADLHSRLCDGGMSSMCVLLASICRSMCPLFWHRLYVHRLPILIETYGPNNLFQPNFTLYEIQLKYDNFALTPCAFVAFNIFKINSEITEPFNLIIMV